MAGHLPQVHVGGGAQMKRCMCNVGGGKGYVYMYGVMGIL